jgi:tetratricopeptide (TPR) repeat protein
VVAGDDTSSEVYGYNLLAEGFTEYRLGHYKRAVALLRKAEPMDIGSNCRTETYFLLAMARFKLNRLDDSRESFASAMNDLNTKLAREGHLDEEWNHWITAHVLMREATALVGSNESGATAQ